MIDVIKSRHSVRRYIDKAIPDDIAEKLLDEAKKCNDESGMNIQVIFGDNKAFSGLKSKTFKNVNNYIALVGKGKDPDETLGYYGERLVLKAQSLGLNSCWVAMTYSKGKCLANVGDGEKLVLVISLGYGETQGVARKSKTIEKVCKTDREMPAWFRSGMEAVLLAPTAMNQQRFMFTLAGNTVKAESTGGFYSDVDLGIVKYHFEIGAGKDNFEWV